MLLMMKMTMKLKKMVFLMTKINALVLLRTDKL